MSGLSLSEVQAILDRIRYKPGWEFLVAPAGDTAWYHEPDGAYGDDLLLVVTYPAPDSRDPGHEDEVTCITARYMIPWGMSGHMFRHWFRACVLARTEGHEIDEWFRYDGVLVRDPHAVATEREK